jgi:Tail fiber protein gp32
MAQDVSGFGAVVTVVATGTFPSGFNVTQFADDADPFDIPETVIAETAMGVNGDLVTWSKATPLKVDLAVISASDDDQNLAILLEANRVGRGKVSAQDIITITIVYPSGNTKTFAAGKITAGMVGSSISAAGKLKTKKYVFAFENAVGLGS